MRTYSMVRDLDDDNPYENPQMIKAIDLLKSLFESVSDEQLKALFDLTISFRQINGNKNYDHELKEKKKLERALMFSNGRGDGFTQTLNEVVRISMSFTDDDHADLVSLVAQERSQRAMDREQAERRKSMDEIFRQM